MGTASSGPSGNEGKVSTEAWKREVAVLLPAPQDSCGIAEVTESTLDSALCGIPADNSTALPARAGLGWAGLSLGAGNVSKSGGSLSAAGAVCLQVAIAFAKLLRAV